MIAENLFSAEEKRRIEEAIRRVERDTVGEVAVVVVEKSDDYPEAELLGGILFGTICALAITWIHFDSSMWMFVALSFCLFFPSRILFRRFPRLAAGLVGEQRMERTVTQRALGAFYEKGLYRTKHETGVLFFISLFERKVWILADRGIYEKIEQQTLNRFADTVSRGIRDGRAADALCDAIREAGSLLAKHFPTAPDDVNELPNRILDA